MSIEALKDGLSKFKEGHPLHPLFQTKGHGANDLLVEAIKCIIDIYELLFPNEVEPEINEPWISLMTFYEKTHLCHPSTIAKQFRIDEEFFKKCGMRKGSRFFIRENAALEYLAACKSEKLKKRALKYLIDKERENEPCQTDDYTHTILQRLSYT